MAVEASPGFTAASFGTPSSFSGGDNEHCELTIEAAFPACDAYTVTVTNAGAESSDSSDVVIDDALPAGLVARRVSLFETRFHANDLGGFLCTSVPLRCTWKSSVLGPLAPDEHLTMVVYVTVEAGLSGSLLNGASVSGGGAASVSTARLAQEANTVSSTPPAFGASQLGFSISGPDGRVDRQAGDHPYELTTTIGLRTSFQRFLEGGEIGARSVEDPKDVLLDLPLGFVGSTVAAPQCTLAQLSSDQQCPANTQVGMIQTEPKGLHSTTVSPIWNMVPEQGVPAEFGFRDGLKGAHIFYVHVVPSPRGYVLESQALDIPEVDLTRISVTFFGDPAVRDAATVCGAGSEPREVECRQGLEAKQVPFFTNPTSCDEGELRAVMHMDSWQHPGRWNADGTPDLSDPAWTQTVSESPVATSMTGCDLLAFGPGLSAQPTTFQADTPSGLSFELTQAQSETVGTLATATLKRALVKLPAGMTVDPSAADGLQACSESEIGWVGPSPAAFDPSPQHCPEASKIGTLELSTPLIAHHLTGAIYLASQDQNPFGSVLAAYVVVDDPVTGVLVKLAGRLFSDPGTGQLTAVFDENPNLPFEDLKLSFFAGPRAELATPEACGAYTTTSELESWSAIPGSGLAATPSDGFSIESGCVNGFNPSFVAGDTNLQAGAFSPFVASFARSDGDQELAGLTLTLPEGLLARIAGVPLCTDAQLAQAQAGTGGCPASRVGSVTVAAGPGPNPLFVTGGVYLTGPYNGGPYGLAVIVPAVAGPFDFGEVVVRQSLRIDPLTAQVTDVSDPFPTFLRPVGADGQINGIPIKLRRVDVSIDRPGFTFNPTSCDRMSLTGSVASVQGASVPVSTPFQITNCAHLRFTPSFKVSVTGRTSRTQGAGLSASLSYPPGSLGAQANIAGVKVVLPKQLPSRLTTLQKACLAATFEANPANCPAASVIGHATVSTPLLALPLSGPAYFVSHGGEAFPSLTIVLQGNGVTVKLTGATLIRKGITSTTFRSTPDVPFSAFKLILPQGPYSALAANGSLCKSRLLMPTLLQAQNGQQIRQNTRITPTGCPKHHKRHPHKRHPKR